MMMLFIYKVHTTWHPRIDITVVLAKRKEEVADEIKKESKILL